MKKILEYNPTKWKKKKPHYRYYRLHRRHILVLILRVGLYGNERHTLKECGVLFGITGESIRAIEARAYRMLCHPCRKKYYIKRDYFRGLKKIYPDFWYNEG